MRIFGKILAVLSILIIGGLLTCGGNFILFNTSIHSYDSIGKLIVFWFFELLVILIYAIWRIFLKKETIGIYSQKTPETSKVNPESTDLMYSLSHADISSIDSATFLPKNGQAFTIKTPNIKRLAVYITTKLDKTVFEAEELRKPFDHVVKHIQSDLSKGDFDLIQGKISEFVKSGGEVKVNKM